jgi:hypothetical protein
MSASCVDGVARVGVVGVGVVCESMFECAPGACSRDGGRRAPRSRRARLA